MLWLTTSNAFFKSRKTPMQCNVACSVVDLYTLNFDPDQECLPNLDLDPGLFFQFWRKKIIKNILEKHYFKKKYHLFNYKKIIAP